MKTAIILLILTLISISGCVVYPGPWSKESYVSEIDSVHHAPPEMNKKFAPYFIDKAFVSIFFRAINGTSHSGGSPYRVYFSILGNEDAYTSVRIHDVKIKMEDIEFTEFKFLFCKDFEQELNNIGTPPFKVSRLSSDFNGRVWFYTTPIEVDAQRIKLIKVELDIEIFTKTGAVRKILQQEFRYELKKGFWSWVEV